MNWLFPLVILAACGKGEWIVSTWGEEYIEEQIPASVFEDGCSIRYERFVVAIQEVALVDGNGEDVGAVEAPAAMDMTLPGPTALGTVEVPADHYDEVRLVISPPGTVTTGNADEAAVAALEAGQSVLAAGTLTCAGVDYAFDWAFDEATTYTCAPEDLTFAPGGSDTSELTIHGDHLFYDGLTNADARVRGLAVAGADANGDLSITLDELAAVGVAGLGYEVGPYVEVTNLRQFISHLSRTLGHIDGEGECRVDL